MPFPQLAPALTAGRIDAAYLVEPFLSLAVKKAARARILTTGDDAIASTYLASAWFATAPWAKAHAPLVSAFAGAIESAARWANANPTAVVPIILKHLKADPAIVAATSRTVYADRLVLNEIQPWIDITAKYAKFPPFPASELVYVPGR